MTYDKSVYDLALSFLKDSPIASHAHTEAIKSWADSLAIELQTRIEDFLQGIENGVQK